MMFSKVFLAANVVLALGNGDNPVASSEIKVDGKHPSSGTEAVEAGGEPHIIEVEVAKAGDGLGLSRNASFLVSDDSNPSEPGADADISYVASERIVNTSKFLEGARRSFCWCLCALLVAALYQYRDEIRSVVFEFIEKTLELAYAEEDLLSIETGKWAFSNRGNATTTNENQLADLVGIAFLMTTVWGVLEFVSTKMVEFVKYIDTVWLNPDRPLSKDTEGEKLATVLFPKLIAFLGGLACLYGIFQLDAASDTSRAIFAADLAIGMCGLMYCFYRRARRFHTGRESQSENTWFADIVYCGLTLLFTVGVSVAVYFSSAFSEQAFGILMAVITCLAIVLFLVEFFGEGCDERTFNPYWTLVRSIVLSALLVAAVTAYQWFQVQDGNLEAMKQITGEDFAKVWAGDVNHWIGNPAFWVWKFTTVFVVLRMIGKYAKAALGCVKSRESPV